MGLDSDIIERIQSSFGPAEASVATQELSASGKSGRIARCIVFAAGGSLQRLRQLIGLADLDFRDVIVAGEYDGAMRRMRDLRVSFAISSPQDFWISEVAITAHRHGYQLSRLETNVVSTPPFAGASGQGVACFVKNGREVRVQKKDSVWSVDQVNRNLAAYGLDSPLADEERFRIQLDFLLSEESA